MKINTNLVVIVILHISVSFQATTIIKPATSTPVLVDNPTCTLRKDKSQISYPSLQQCYIYTKDSCCTSTHDDVIAGKLTELVSAECAPDFDNLVQYFCFGCYNNQANYLDEKTKTIRLCKDFAARIWAG